MCLAHASPPPPPLPPRPPRHLAAATTTSLHKPSYVRKTVQSQLHQHRGPRVETGLTRNAERVILTAPADSDVPLLSELKNFRWVLIRDNFFCSFAFFAPGGGSSCATGCTCYGRRWRLSEFSVYPDNELKSDGDYVQPNINDEYIRRHRYHPYHYHR